jgi:hypothetical protein
VKQNVCQAGGILRSHHVHETREVRVPERLAGDVLPCLIVVIEETRALPRKSSSLLNMLWHFDTLVHADQIEREDVALQDWSCLHMHNFAGLQ